MSHIVEFVGGALDGHVQPLPYSPDLLASTLDLPVSVDLLRMLGGDNDRPLGVATSLAVYELQHDGSRYVYRHLRSTAAEQHQLDGA